MAKLPNISFLRLENYILFISFLKIVRSREEILEFGYEFRVVSDVTGEYPYGQNMFFSRTNVIEDNGNGGLILIIFEPFGERPFGAP